MHKCWIDTQRCSLIVPYCMSIQHAYVLNQLAKFFCQSYHAVCQTDAQILIVYMCSWAVVKVVELLLLSRIQFPKPADLNQVYLGFSVEVLLAWNYFTQSPYCFAPRIFVNIATGVSSLQILIIWQTKIKDAFFLDFHVDGYLARLNPISGWSFLILSNLNFIPTQKKTVKSNSHTGRRTLAYRVRAGDPNH
jgi:hypothetical protein